MRLPLMSECTCETSKQGLRDWPTSPGSGRVTNASRICSASPSMPDFNQSHRTCLGEIGHLVLPVCHATLFYYPDDDGLCVVIDLNTDA